MTIKSFQKLSISSTDPKCLNELYSFSNYEKNGKKALQFSVDRYLLCRKLFDPVLSKKPRKPLIIVAGTKGKGSTCHFISRILNRIYKKVGLYTSPHILRINERIALNNIPLSNIDFDNLYHNVMDICRAFSSENPEYNPSTFEILTLMAKTYFDRLDTDIDIFEAGLGGRFDAVNCLQDKRISVITSISLDHTDILGNTYDEIFSEKLPVARDRQPLFIGYQRHLNLKRYDECLSAFKTYRYKDDYYYKEYNGDLHFFCDSGCIASIRSRPHFPEFHKYNLALAFAVAYHINKHISGRKSYDLNEFRLDCRFEIVRHKKKTLILDGAHNKDSLENLLCNIWHKWPGKPKALIFGCMADKDINGMLKAISSYRPSIVILQKIHSERSYDFSNDSSVKDILFNYKICNGTEDVYDLICANSDFDDWVICITGSLYLCSEYKRIIDAK